MSGQSVVQHLAAALGAGLSSALLIERPDRSLGGMPALALVAMGLTLAVPLLVTAILRRMPAAEQPPVSRAAAR